MGKSTALLVVALLGGCVSGPNTASGRPELVVRLDAKAAKARLVNAYSSSGFNIEASDDMGFAIAQPLSGMQEAMIGRGVHRIRFNLFEANGATTIRSTSFVVTSMGSTETSTAKAGVDVQQSLEGIFRDVVVLPSAAPTR
jgi:hypothetical protein